MPHPGQEVGEKISNWRGLIRRLGLSAESSLERLNQRIEHQFNPNRSVQIVAYRGFANQEKGYLSARILANPQSKPETTQTNQSIWRNLADSYRRFETDEVPNARVFAYVGDRRFNAVSDAEGYVHFTLTGPFQNDKGIIRVTLSLPDLEDADEVIAEMVSPTPNSKFGVISDVDDTVMVTNATSVIAMMRLTLLESSSSRLAFAGVADFYKALHQGTNPFFYISSSPWNLYDFLEDFFTVKGIVKGSMQLRDFGYDESKLVAGPHVEHKLKSIVDVISLHPELPFVLIGDSGQDDVDIYAEAVRRFNTQIQAVYVRDVSGDVRDNQVRKVLENIESMGVPALLVPDTQAAAVHAVSLGLINEAALSKIGEAAEFDLAPCDVIEDQIS